MTSQPIEANFFPYLEQLPAGDLVRMVAQDLFSWARQFADELAFGGRSNPGFHIRINVDGKLVTICSIRAYRMTPSAQLPLDYLAAHKPYDKRVKRRATLRKLNRLLPKDARFAVAKADKRPAIPLTYLRQRGETGRVQVDCAGDCWRFARDGQHSLSGIKTLPLPSAHAAGGGRSTSRPHPPCFGSSVH